MLDAVRLAEDVWIFIWPCPKHPQRIQDFTSALSDCPITLQNLCHDTQDSQDLDLALSRSSAPSMVMVTSKLFCHVGSPRLRSMTFLGRHGRRVGNTSDRLSIE